MINDRRTCFYAMIHNKTSHKNTFFYYSSIWKGLFTVQIWFELTRFRKHFSQYIFLFTLNKYLYRKIGFKYCMEYKYSKYILKHFILWEKVWIIMETEKKHIQQMIFWKLLTVLMSPDKMKPMSTVVKIKKNDTKTWNRYQQITGLRSATASRMNNFWDTERNYWILHLDKVRKLNKKTSD